jgi:RNA polymerase sigma factor (sigma-70 family)
MQDIELLKEIMRLHTTSLVRLAYYYVKDRQAAEDIVQEVFIKFYHLDNQYEDRGELKAYLYKMTANKSKDFLKTWAYRKIHLQQTVMNIGSVKSMDALLMHDEQVIVAEAILQLPVKQREALIYYYFQDMTVAEIATLLDIPANTVKTRLRKGRILLRTKLEHVEWEVLLDGTLYSR